MVSLRDCLQTYTQLQTLACTVVSSDTDSTCLLVAWVCELIPVVYWNHLLASRVS